MVLVIVNAMNHNDLRQNKAFTLIEILVVAAIISLISSIIVSSVDDARSSARDAQRQTDLNSIRSGMAIYFDNNGHYPSNYTELENAEIMSQIPVDPVEGVRYPFATSTDDFDICIVTCMEDSANGGGSSNVCPNNASTYSNDPGNYISSCDPDNKYFISF